MNCIEERVSQNTLFDPIDELGYLPIDQDAVNLFFQLIARRYEKHCTIITTNIPFSRWREIFGSPTLANAVLDRLLHHSQIISIKEPPYHLRKKWVFMESVSEDSRWENVHFYFPLLSIFIQSFTICDAIDDCMEDLRKN